MRPLFARAIAEHEALVAEAGAERYLRRNGWLKLYRGDRSFAAQARELELAANSASPMWRSTARRRARSNLRSSPCSATLCIGPAR